MILTSNSVQQAIVDYSSPYVLWNLKRPVQIRTWWNGSSKCKNDCTGTCNSVNT